MRLTCGWQKDTKKGLVQVRKEKGGGTRTVDFVRAADYDTVLICLKALFEIDTEKCYLSNVTFHL